MPNFPKREFVKKSKNFQTKNIPKKKDKFSKKWQSFKKKFKKKFVQKRQNFHKKWQIFQKWPIFKQKCQIFKNMNKF